MISFRLCFRVLVFLCVVGGCFSACGDAPLERRNQPIIGGQEDLSHPAVGVLTTDTFTPFCTATLITPRLALTAAHCLDIAKALNLKLRFRIDLPSKAATGFDQHFVDVETTSVHARWAPATSAFDNDIALLHFREPIPLIQPVSLYPNAMEGDWLQKRITAIGYGLLQTRPKIIGATRKHSVELPISEVIPLFFRVFDTNKSPCSGDSGGPALFQDGEQSTILGVASHVTGSLAAPNQPACDGMTAYLRIDAYQTWLKPFLEQPQGTCKQDTDCTAPQRCRDHTRFEEPCDTTSKRCVCLSPGTIEEKQACSFARRCKDGFTCQEDKQQTIQTCQPAGCGCQSAPLPSEMSLYALLVLLALVWRRRIFARVG